ncbi:(2Fe-2S) ferredoxin domain-containing protein [Clostridium tagluense]|uniref:(2Fe-2S) ferredoxin domain-containing protein n=1 Tax=Clostridium TaxID=1485 RepID=UPI00165262EE|nr:MULTISPECIES: (2Fe-2S) ferredoxin domain-containing protein [Clostridium]MBU3129368.1 (2Fe-2S) ferredoxin domain-containing protein [Clostridium tagluense]MBW9157879.1 (2Fe-2S) ferredoxin domain-containing protein [Clostridium tagluense]MBZ9622785.1 (2Fe-2S) ferredoxin domain-containing protein [Clostridium sp. FP2]MCB2296476.1 (2Fe-2S) ferredoxin domain-containing protein [Clostridium tagluense]MCB2310729.1 (2Fe-2S) ferredoxin domain-containing protein [Clostridium tagluense]
MIDLSVCVGSACHIKGSYNVINNFQQIIEEYNLADKVQLKAIFCLGHCTKGVSVKIDDGEVYSVSGATSRKFFETEILPKLVIKK